MLRALVGVVVVLGCSAFVPVGGCAKGCGRAASHGDDFARTGSRFGDDLARTGAHYGDDLARTRVHVGDELAHTATAELDDLAKLELTPHQSEEVSQALDIAKDVGEEVLGQLADADSANDDDAHARLEAATKDLENRLARALTPQQLRDFHARYGSAAEVITRLGEKQGSAAAKP